MASFTDRARNAYAREDYIRALMILINGLKRGRDSDDAVQLLLRWYGLENPLEGLEADVAAALATQHDANDLLSVLIDNLDRGGYSAIADTLLEEGLNVGVTYIAAEPDALSGVVPMEPVPKALPDFLPEDTLDGMPALSLPVPEEEEDESDRAETELDSIALLHAAANTTPAIRSEQRQPQTDVEQPPQPQIGDEPPLEHEAPTPQVPEGGASRGQSQKRRGEPRPRRFEPRRLVGIAIVIAILTGLLAVGWKRARHSAEIVSLDSRFQTMDPLDVAALRAEVAHDVAHWPGDPEFVERLFFVDILAGKGSTLDIVTTPWGLAGRCLGAGRSGDTESALQARARLERTEPDGLAFSWCDAALAESSGNQGRALTLWRVSLERHPTFVSGYLGAIRTSVRRGDAKSLGWALTKLKVLIPDHPYLAAGALDMPSRSPYFDLVPIDVQPLPEAKEGTDAALSSFVYLIRAQLATNARDWETAGREVETAVALDPLLAPAQLLATVLRAGRYDLESALQGAQALSNIKGLTREFESIARAAVGRSIVFAGRPDMAARLLGMSKGAPKTWMSHRFEGSLDNVVTDATVLNEMGRSQEAVSLLTSYFQRHGDPQAGYVAHLITLQNGTKLDVDIELPREASEALKAAVAHFEGSHQLAADLGSKLLDESPYRAITIRFVVQSLLALRQVGKALALIEAESPPLVDRIFLDGVRLRALSRLAPGNGDFKQLFGRMMSVEPMGVNRTTDLAYAAFWQGESDRTSILLGEALARNESHRKANWLKGVLLRSQGKFKAAAPYMARAGRDINSNPGVLLELGNVNFELGNFDEARKMFYRSMLQNRDDLVALKGLGRAYAAIGGEVPARDLERILDHYPRTEEYAPHRAEVMKWLAVIRGVRTGDREALVWLDSAEALVGRRADLLVERARCDEANQDYAAARRLYALALQNNSTLPEAHLGLGRAALKMGDHKVAKDHLKKYLDFSVQGPDRQWVEENLANF